MGAAAITAATEGLTAQVGVNVPGVPDLSALILEPSSVTISVMDTVRLTATVLDSLGVPITDAAPQFFSVDTLVATVDQTGLVTGVAQGMTDVVAEFGFGGVADTTDVTVVP